MTIAPKAAGLDRSYEDQFIVPSPPRGKHPPVGPVLADVVAEAKRAKSTVTDMPAAPDMPYGCEGPSKLFCKPAKYRTE